MTVVEQRMVELVVVVAAVAAGCGVSLAAPIVVRLFGWETSDFGARIIHASNDVQKALG